MNSFEYGAPTSLPEAISLLSPRWGPTEILAGGTDLVALMKDYAVTPRRLVSLKRLPGMGAIAWSPSKGLRVGALATLDELARHPAVVRHYPALAQALGDAASPQIRNRATVGGNLCQRPRCWYFRNGYGLLALDSRKRSLVLLGDNRYHAILGNGGPAYFVSPSTIAPTLVALGARVRVAGPGRSPGLPASRLIALESFYRAPTKEGQREHALRPDEVLVELSVPPPGGSRIAYYEVRQKHGFDWPFATATVRLDLAGEKVASAVVMMGHVAPTPWRSREAEGALAGQVPTDALAAAAGRAAVGPAKSLGQNGYKIAIAQVAVERAVLLAAGLAAGAPWQEAAS
ncbi:MAG TPA: FAD binding domain-containing protein [Anaeromyxobacteraceae bacterium]|nr:FAD binding domain-containing protein [Anaeromyxobacteraceae bacterium]